MRIDPNDEQAETDESNNESMIIVDVPTATRPAPVDGTDLTYAYPPYVTYTRLEEQNLPQVWAFMIFVPMRNNGTSTIPQMDVRCFGDYTGSATTTSSFGPGVETLIGIGRGSFANEHFQVDVLLDPDGSLHARSLSKRASGVWSWLTHALS
ncbi:MAG: hypothetical protein H0W83_01025 [Planctomycetes bacterium]|nr:hypothetical protein [Planctomycetota bacterium]